MSSTAEALPKINDTLGPLFIGYSITTLYVRFCFDFQSLLTMSAFLRLYGIACLQVFIYITSKRAQNDKFWLKCVVAVIL